MIFVCIFVFKIMNMIKIESIFVNDKRVHTVKIFGILVYKKTSEVYLIKEIAF